ncbi:MAG TPA: CGNR zinc finger domain-containing protein [Micromonosporaceae bacterium]|nr:CGNR zinc finger domain-containing protein [Micromonosporaceae bacterium]
MHEFEFYAGAACLDFTNTVDSRDGPELEEHLHTYADLLDWARQGGLIDAAEHDALARAAAELPDGGAAALDAARELREAIFRTFHAIAEGASPPAADLDTVQRHYADATRHARLATTADGGFAWSWPDAPDKPAWLVARSAMKLALTGPLDRLKVCASEGWCAALFLDTSKNRSRRWCTMSGGCGDEVKFRRQAARRRAATRPSA